MPHSVVLFALFYRLSQAFSIPNVNATFQPYPQPFEIEVDPSFIDGVRNRVEAARAPVAVEGVQNDGPPLANFTVLQDYWANEYNWTASQSSINQQLEQYTTIVQPNTSAYPFQVPLHFVHHRSARPDAIPLLFIHGWPGSFLEVSKIIGPLTTPSNVSSPAFHVVAPSIPGFGFSPAPEHAGFGPEAAAHTFDALMQQLNYTKYVAQGGDFGAITLRYQAHHYPEKLISLLSNFWPVEPSNEDISRLSQNLTTAEETAYINHVEHFIHQDSGYRLIQETKPLQLAYGLTDSPLGFALWIYTLMGNVVDPADFEWQPDDIITWSMMYTIQGPYGGLRFYKEALADGAFAGFGLGMLPYVRQPVAISEFPYDLWYDLPLDWAQRGGDVKVRNVHDRGGHFAAYEVPDLLVEDIRSWFGNGELSGTSIFNATST